MSTISSRNRPFSGRHFLVTGASKGLGLAVVERIAQMGGDILAHAHSGDLAAAQEIADRAGVALSSFHADLADHDQVMELSDWAVRSGPVDGLVNNAGICSFTDFFQVSLETWESELAINARAAFFLMQAIARSMVEGGIRGRIVNFSSVAAHAGTPTQVHYGAAKGAVEGLTKNAAVALGSYGITVNAVVPGPIPTEHNSRFLEEPTAQKALLDTLPMGEYGKPEYVAGAVTHLLSDAAAWTTGTLLTVDGGLLSV